MNLAIVLSALIASNIVATAEQYATPSPAGGACPETPVTITKAVQPKYPATQMRFTDYRVTVEVIVYVNADGSVKTASIAKSSGYAEPDAEVLKAAYASKYKPRTVNCNPADGLYLFRADFAPP